MFNEGAENTPRKEKKSPDALFRDQGIKIKLTIPTSFGTEYVLYKKYSKAVLDKILAGYRFDTALNSVFVFK